MIKETEINLGNYFVGHANKIFKWDYTHFELLQKGFDLDEIIKEPILPTEELLFELGFEHDEGGFSQYRRVVANGFGNYTIHIDLEKEIFDGKETTLVVFGMYDDIEDVFSYFEIYHIHEIQNFNRLISGEDMEFTTMVIAMP